MIKIRLAQVESQIQRLVEGGAARVFPIDETSNDADPGTAPNETGAVAQFDQESAGETRSINVSTQKTNLEQAAVPPQAFLIARGRDSSAQTQVFPLEHIVTTIGRQDGNDLLINDPRVSRAHAQIRLIGNQFKIFDLDSTGGTYVNRQRVKQRFLCPGDVISLAGIPLVFGQDELDSQDGSTRPMKLKPKPVKPERFL